MKNARDRAKRTNSSQGGLLKRGHKTKRKLVLDSGTWEYWISPKSVIIFSPKGKKYVTRCDFITGEYMDVERGRRKGTRDGWICPSDVRGHIEREILV